MTTTEVAVRDERGEIDIFHPTTVFDLERYEQVNRVAIRMAHGSLMPAHMKGANIQEAEANCFLMCNLAAQWGLDPFAVVQASALVFGKIVLEGKLVRTVINKFLGFDLHYHFDNADKDRAMKVIISDRPFVDAEGNEVGDDDPGAVVAKGSRYTEGDFEKWHTSKKDGGVNDNWAKDRPKMFRERGAREWCREWAPGLMLGVYTPDEFDEVEQTARSNRARDVTGGALGDNPLQDSGVQTPATGNPSSAGSEGDEPKTPAEATRSRAAGTGNQASAERPSQASPSQENRGGPGGGSDDSSLSRVPAETWMEYHRALGGMASEERVLKQSDAFWKGKKISAADIKLGGEIKKAHVQRVKGDIAPALVTSEVERLIAESLGEPK